MSGQNSLIPMLRLWSYMTAAVFIVMLTHQSDQPILLNRYSILVTLTLFMLAGIFVLSRMGIRLFQRPVWEKRYEQLMVWLRSQRMVQGFILVLAMVAIVLIWMRLLSNFPVQYAVLRAYLVVTIVMWVPYFAPIISLRLRWGQAAFLMGSLVIFLITVSVAEFYPALARTDEAFIFSMSRNYLETGAKNPMIYRNSIPLPDYSIGVLWYRTLPTWLSVTGYSLYAGRLYSVLVITLSALMLSWGVQRLYHGISGYVVLCLSLFAFGAHIFIRFDSHGLFFMALSVLIYSFVRNRPGIIGHILAGFMAGMAIDSAPSAFTVGAGYAAVYGLHYFGHIRQGKLLWLPFWGLAIGGMIAAGIFVTSFGSNSVTGQVVSTSATESVLDAVTFNLNPADFISLINQFFANFVGYQPIMVMLALLAVFSIWRMNDDSEQRQLDREWLVMLVVWFAGILLVYPYFPVYYGIFGLGFVVILAGRAISFYLSDYLHHDTSQQGGISLSATVLLLTWLFTNIAFGINSLPGSSLEDVVIAGERIADVIPVDSVVVAAEPYYFGMLDHMLFLGGATEVQMRVIQGVDGETYWNQLQPDAFIFSQNWPQEPRRTEALEAYMANNDFEKTGCWITGGYGFVELWSHPDLLVADAPVDPCEPIVIPRLSGG